MELLIGLLALIIIPIGLSIWSSNYRIISVDEEKYLRDNQKNRKTAIDIAIRKQERKNKRKRKKSKKNYKKNI